MIFVLIYQSKRDNLVLKSPKDFEEFMAKLPEKLKEEPELRKKIQDEIFEVDMDLLKQFKKTADAGDAAYLEVYLYSKFKEYKKKYELAKKRDSGENENKTKLELMAS